MSTVAERLALSLKNAGVKYVFGVPGGPSLPYLEAMRRSGLDFILVKNEASAGIMATVCGQITGVPAVCHATFGPGATNLTTGVGCAYLDRVPLIAMTSEMSDSQLKRTVQMNIDQQALFKQITKWTTRLTPDNVEGTVKKALEISLSEVTGPVHVGLPADIAERPAEGDGSDIIICPKGPPKPLEKELENMKKVLQGYKKPLLAVGLSAARLRLQKNILRVVEKHNLPVVLTPMAKGIVPESHPNYIGVVFHALSHMLNPIVNQADLIIGIGYDPVEFNYEDWMPEAPLLHIDTVKADVDNSIKVIGDVVGDLKYSIKELLTLEPAGNDWNLEEVKKNKEQLFSALRPNTKSFSPSAALDALRCEMSEDGIMTCDVGAHTHLIGQLWSTPRPGLQMMTNGWSSMGFGVPAAIGAKICLPETQVVCVCGDGGFLMMLGEIVTARRLQLDVTFVVFTDNKLTLIDVKQKRKNFENYGVTLYKGSLLESDKILGVPVLSAKNEKQMKKCLKNAFSIKGPVVIEASINGSIYKELISRR